MSTEVSVRNESTHMAMTSHQVKDQVQLIQEVMRDAMKNGEHYGVIPGCGTKPALLKAGAEKLALTFRLAPSYKIERTDFPNYHREYVITCELRHIESGKLLGAGVGSCSTMESKYRWRNANRKCPECGKETIIKGKAEFGGGWLCFGKKGGCGAKWSDGDQAIEGQEVGRIENTDVADQYNTVLKMAKKRAQVDATLTALAASDIFTQDIEERLGDDAIPTEATVTESKPLQQAPNIIAIVTKEAKDCETTEILKAYKDELFEKKGPWWTDETKAIIAERLKEIKAQAETDELNRQAMERAA